MKGFACRFNVTRFGVGYSFLLGAPGSADGNIVGFQPGIGQLSGCDDSIDLGQTTDAGEARVLR